MAAQQEPDAAQAQGDAQVSEAPQIAVHWREEE
jgi:hypothetical protein